MLLAVSIMVASGTVSAIVMALAGVYFSAQSSTCEDGADGNITNVILPDNGTDYIYSVDKFDLDGDDVNQKRKEKIKEVIKLVFGFNIFKSAFNSKLKGINPHLKC